MKSVAHCFKCSAAFVCCGRKLQLSNIGVYGVLCGSVLLSHISTLFRDILA